MPKGLRPITTYDVFMGPKTVTTAAAETSQAFDLREVAQDGLFSIDYANATSGGTLAITYTMCSTKNGTYFTPTGGGTIISGSNASPPVAVPNPETIVPPPVGVK